MLIYWIGSTLTLTYQGLNPFDYKNKKNEIVHISAILKSNKLRFLFSLFKQLSISSIIEPIADSRNKNFNILKLTPLIRLKIRIKTPIVRTKYLMIKNALVLSLFSKNNPTYSPLFDK